MRLSFTYSKSKVIHLGESSQIFNSSVLLQITDFLESWDDSHALEPFLGSWVFIKDSLSAVDLEEPDVTALGEDLEVSDGWSLGASNEASALALKKVLKGLESLEELDVTSLEDILFCSSELSSLLK